MAGTLTVRNLQRIVKFDVHKLKRDSLLLRQLLLAEPYDIGIICVGNRKIRNLNKQYRSHDKETNVLSFPYHVGLVPGNRPCPQNLDDYNLGDIFLGMPYIHDVCIAAHIELRKHLICLVLHGFCHLLGYDHEDDNSATKMMKLEERIIKQFDEITGLSINLESDLYFN